MSIGILSTLVLGLTLSGCSTYEDLFAKDDGPKGCPRVAVLADAATVTRFTPGPGRDLADVTYEGVIRDLKGECAYDVDRKTKEGTLSVKIAVEIEALRGPANRGDPAVFPYFISVVTPDQRVLNKKEFSVSVPFPDNRTRATIIDLPIDLVFPISKDLGAKSYEIFAGFQLTREEIEYNRNTRNR
ncbi:MAG: hypothetical protein OQJ87_02405 [Rhodospirillales bacterium]|nr:hypothetical protein [Rhodospirillales bacterium]MCW9039794.1 hypothetical protein [Rhodospirillales bacterium]